MKLIKKMLAIMFAFMMVVGMGTKVNAEENGSTTEPAGKITINNAVDGQTYSIYKVLELESFSGDNYSYKPASEEWKNFLNKDVAKNYVTINENGYVNWEGDSNDTRASEFAKLALEYAKTNEINNNGRSNAKGNTVTFDKLPLGYYLVDSSVGALCGLNTTNSEVTIQEKNDVPTVDKTVNKDNDWVKDNSVNIGDTVTFKTEIKIETGATNYVLHDEMGKGLELVESLNKLIHFVAPKGYPEPKENEYTVVRNKQENSDGFTITFQDSYIQTLPAGSYLKLTYCAVVTNDAPINTAMNNKTWLTFGDNNTSTKESETNTYTFGIPVFKYTGIDKTPLAGAKFTLYTDESCAADKALKFKLNDITNKYRYDANGLEILTSLDNTGRVDIEGIKAGTYYLKEVEAPKGYNKLASAINVRIDSDGKIYLNGSNVVNAGDVKVENKTGTLLPSTGGMGTTIIYMAGAILVIASGIVLVSKKRSKAK